MKINAEVFIERLNKIKLEGGIYLISGNELSFINHVERLIVKNLEYDSDYEIIHYDFKEKNKASLKNLFSHKSLFNKKNIIIIYNPRDELIKSLENNFHDNSTTIINGESILKNSKLKQNFDTHEKYYSIYCYELSSGFKKRLINQFIKKQGIELVSDTYWFLLENTSNSYKLLENDLEKILLYGKNNITIEELKKILTYSNQAKLDELFFQCVVGNNKSIIKKTENTILTSADAYKCLQILKNFSNILAQTSEKKSNESVNSLVNKYLPKYLFRQKVSFEKAVISANLDKVIIINNLIQKTELMLRNNDSLFLVVIQRFLINFAKTLK